MSFLFRKADASSAVPSSILGSEMDSNNTQIRTPEEAGTFNYTMPLPYLQPPRQLLLSPRALPTAFAAALTVRLAGQLLLLDARPRATPITACMIAQFSHCKEHGKRE
jgi:hypothetical protein